MDQISKLTDRQIFTLYLRERDKDGVPLPIVNPKIYRQSKNRDAEKVNFFTTGSMFGVPQSVLLKQWAEQSGEPL